MSQTHLIAKIISKAIEKERTLSIDIRDQEDLVEISCEKGTNFEIDPTWLFIEEHYYLFKDVNDESLGKDEHILSHLIRISEVTNFTES